ncbi:glycosyltransferase family 4 protein [Alsobacter sp. SYSU M60028]|uniref:Glycosyltransferase family 4 protein n=1 Tax=Alsobacter ponti TaxID=2962936 RepID=A0ABT1LBR6_9HYPH|nr:glycosyltransferase family 4 protein [Alsobacter ponti]MCP8938940.1 glycosyltransferase family 4 protein [Alsobacter ponti]
MTRLLMTTDAVGGVWTYALDLARGLAAHGTETILAVLGPEPDAAQEAAARAIPGLRLARTGLPLDWTATDRAEVAHAGARLAALAGEVEADLVQLHAPALAAGAAFPVPCLGVHHSCLATWHRAVKGDAALPEDFRWRVEMAADGLRAVDAVVAPSAAFARAVAEAYGLRRPPAVARNGRAPPPRSDAPAGTHELFALTAGRLWDEGKDVATLDRAAARLAWPVLAAGPLRAPHGGEAALRHARALGPLGEAEMRLWLRDAPVFASAALYEPFGLGVLEAAQAGCALVLSDIPTFRELWDGAALFAPPRDDAAFAQALDAVLRDEALRATLAAKAGRRARRYTVEAMAGRMARLHAALASDAGRKGRAA